MIRIAHIQLLPLLSGVQRVCLDELQRLDPEKFERYLICSNPGPLTEAAEKAGIKCLYIKTLKREISVSDDLRALKDLISLFRKFKFDIVHTHSSKPGVLGRVAAFLCRVKLIIHTVHGFSFPIARNKIEYCLFYLMEKIGCMCGDLLICLHERDKNIAINKLGVNSDSIYILKNAVDSEKFRQLSQEQKIYLKKKFRLTENSIIIGMIGRLWPQKNPQTLLKAFKIFADKQTHVHLCFIGDGELKSTLEHTSVLNGLSDRVHFFGWQENTELFLNTFDIFVLPSLWEGMPLAILEAQSTSLPCIVSDIPGNNHLIKEGINGFLFPTNNATYLADRLVYLITHPKERQFLGEVSRKIIEKDYNVNVRIALLTNIYEKHLS